MASFQHACGYENRRNATDIGSRLTLSMVSHGKVRSRPCRQYQIAVLANVCVVSYLCGLSGRRPIAAQSSSPAARLVAQRADKCPFRSAGEDSGSAYTKQITYTSILIMPTHIAACLTIRHRQSKVAARRPIPQVALNHSPTMTTRIASRTPTS